MYIAATSPNDYFDRVSEKRKAWLLAIRSIIKDTFPDVKEDLENDMPTYHLDRRMVFSLADQKSFLALYVYPYDLLNVFRNELRAHDHGKSCIRFRSFDDHDLAFIAQVVKYVGTTVDQSIVELKQYVRA